MAARNKAWTPTKVRERIRVAMFMNCLRDHVLGKREMSPTQIDAAKYLISQGIGAPPKSVELSGTVNHVNYDAAVLGLLNGSTVETGDAASAPATIQ